MDNYSSSSFANVTTVDEWNQKIAYVLLPDTVILFVYLVVGLIGNGLVIVVYQAWKNKSETEDRYLIPFLAVCDLMASTVISSFHITLNMKAVSFENNVMCKSLCFLNGFLTYLSIFVLLIIALQRYIKICRPSGKLLMSVHVMKYIFICAVIITMALASPIVLFYGRTAIHKEGTNMTGFKCKRKSNDGYNTQFKIYGSLLVLILMLAIIILSFIYIQIGRKLYAHFQKMKNSHSGNEIASSSKTTNDFSSFSDSSRLTQDTRITDVSDNDKNSKLKLSYNLKRKNDKTMLRLTLIFFTITVAFILSYVPRIIVLIAEGLTPNYWKGLSNSEFAALVFVHQIYIINNILNPIIYGLLDKQFRNKTKIMLRTIKWKCTCMSLDNHAR